MKGKLLKGILATAVFTAIPATFWACGTSSTSSTNSIRTASLTLSAKLKKQGEISSQFLSQDIKCIEYKLYIPTTGTDIKGTVSLNSPSVTIKNLPVSYGKLYLIAKDGNVDGDSCDGNELDRLYAHIKLTEGANTFTATMIGNAKWEFVDNNNNVSPIVLNKINSNSNETLKYFNLSNEYGMIDELSIDTNKPSFFTNYKVMFKGSNLIQNEQCISSDKCFVSGQYFVQFIGPNTSNNAFNTFSLKLADYTDSNGKTYEREAFIIGIPPMYPIKYLGYFGTGGNIDGYGGYGGYQGYDGYGSYDGYDFYNGYYRGFQISSSFNLSQGDGTNVISDFEKKFGYTTVTSANKMEGYLLEVATDVSSEQESVICSWDENGSSQFNCPTNIKGMAKGNAILLTLSKLEEKISTQALGSDNCYRNTTVSEANLVQFFSDSLVWVYGGCASVDVNGDGQNEYVCDYNLDGNLDGNDDNNGDGIINDHDAIAVYVKYSYSANMDICVYPFKAKAGEIPSTDLNLTIQ